MVTTREIIDHAQTLPAEDRAMLVDSILRTLNPPNPDMDRKWADLAEKRMNDLRDGKVQGVPADAVFAKARGRTSS